MMILPATLLAAKAARYLLGKSTNFKTTLFPM